MKTLIQLPVNGLTLGTHRGDLQRWAKAANELFGALNGWRTHQPHEVFTYERKRAVAEARAACNVSDAVREDAVLAMMGWDFDAIDRAEVRFEREKQKWMTAEHLSWGEKGFGISAEGQKAIMELGTMVFNGDLEKEPMNTLMQAAKHLNKLRDLSAVPNLFPGTLDKIFANLNATGETVFPRLLGVETQTLHSVSKTQRKNIKKPHEIFTDGTTNQDS
jgi:hypothetical protein